FLRALDFNRGIVMFFKSNKRSMSNIVIDPRALLRISVPFLALLIANAAVIFWMEWQISSELSQLQIQDATTVTALLSLTKKTSFAGMVGLCAVGVLCFVMWTIYSHRLFGPTVPIRKHLSALKSGDYSSRIHLRRRDEFKQIADELNDLAEILAKKGGR